jgi:hypothetical protein
MLGERRRQGHARVAMAPGRTCLLRRSEASLLSRKGHKQSQRSKLALFSQAHDADVSPITPYRCNHYCESARRKIGFVLRDRPSGVYRFGAANGNGGPAWPAPRCAPHTYTPVAPKRQTSASKRRNPRPRSFVGWVLNPRVTVVAHLATARVLPPPGDSYLADHDRPSESDTYDLRFPIHRQLNRCIYILPACAPASSKFRIICDFLPQRLDTAKFFSGMDLHRTPECHSRERGNPSLLNRRGTRMHADRSKNGQRLLFSGGVHLRSSAVPFYCRFFRVFTLCFCAGPGLQ